MKSLISYFIAIILFFNGGKAISQQVITDQQINQLIRDNIKALHKDKTNLPDTSYKIDTKLSKVTEIICSDTFRTQHATIAYEDIRTLLRKEQIYDYNVHYMSIPVESLKNKVIRRSFKDHAMLQTVLDNPFINKQGIVIEQINGQHIIHLLFTEHYIDISYITISCATHYGYSIYKTCLNGISYLDDIFYIYGGSDKKNKIQLDSADHFQIIIPEQLVFPIDFFDSSGKKLYVY